MIAKKLFLTEVRMKSRYLSVVVARRKCIQIWWSLYAWECLTIRCCADGWSLWMCERRHWRCSKVYDRNTALLEVQQAQMDRKQLQTQPFLCPSQRKNCILLGLRSCGNGRYVDTDIAESILESLVGELNISHLTDDSPKQLVCSSFPRGDYITLIVCFYWYIYNEESKVYFFPDTNITRREKKQRMFFFFSAANVQKSTRRGFFSFAKNAKDNRTYM